MEFFFSCFPDIDVSFPPFLFWFVSTCSRCVAFSISWCEFLAPAEKNKTWLYLTASSSSSYYIYNWPGSGRVPSHSLFIALCCCSCFSPSSLSTYFSFYFLLRPSPTWMTFDDSSFSSRTSQPARERERGRNALGSGFQLTPTLRVFDTADGRERYGPLGCLQIYTTYIQATAKRCCLCCWVWGRYPPFLYIFSFPTSSSFVGS